MSKRISFAEEDKLVFDPIKSSLELTWDSLGAYYKEKTIELQSDKVLKDTVLSKFQAAKVELETIQSTFNLIKENVLMSEKVDIKQRKSGTLTRKIISDALKIVTNKLDMFRSALKKEEKTLEIIKNYDTKIENGLLKIVFNSNYYIVIEGDKLLFPEKWKPKGLKLTIDFKGESYFCIEKCSQNLGTIESVKEYCLEKELIGEYIDGNIKIAIEECDSNEVNNELCLLVLKKMKKKVDREKIFEIIVCYLCRMFCREFYKGQWEVVDTGINRMIDGLSAEYFLVTNGVIIRVVRFKNDFRVFYNEREIKKKGNFD